MRRRATAGRGRRSTPARRGGRRAAARAAARSSNA